MACLCLMCGCGKKQNTTYYEVIDGQIVQSGTEENASSAQSQNDTQTAINEAVPSFSSQFQTEYTGEDVLSSGSSADSYTVGGNISDGVALVFPDEEYNSISQADKGKVKELREIVNNAANACKQTYTDADKGEAINVTLSESTIAKMVADVGTTGVACVDSLLNCNMASFETLDEFGQSINTTTGVISGTYVIVYPDGHLTGFCLCRESNQWHLLATSGEWSKDNSFEIFTEGRYAVGGVKYTERGWLIYSRNTTDFDDNQKANTDPYTMVRVKPYDSTARALAQRYIEPVSYFENNLFITTWSQSDFSAIDFNSLYAYIFGMYNGTEMLSSYNVRNYYKSYGGTRLYVVPTDIFENNVQTYFNIDSSTLKNISDYSYKAGGYFFLGYNRDYYTVTPRTPSPEIISYSYNSDGSISMVVAAVNKWYGTDTAFTHILTVMPTKTGFKYVSNQYLESQDDILPKQVLSEMLDVEKKELG